MARYLVGVWVVVLFTLGEAAAQQDPQFTQYMFNTLYYNPAAAGVDGVTRFTALHRSQWLGYQPSFGGGGAPTTQLLTFSTPLYKISSGIGGYIINDNLGPQNNFEVQAAYAYHKMIGKTKLSVGVRGGIYSQTINPNKYIAIDPNDPRLPAERVTQAKPDLAIGAMVQQEKFYVGVSLNHLIQSNFDFELGGRNPLEPHLYVTGGYFYDINLDLRLQGVTLVKTDLVKTTFDVGGILYYRDVMWGGLSFRQSEAAILILGYSFLQDKSLRLGYGFDYIIKDADAKQPTSHEFMLSYTLPAVPVGRKIIRTPRYRH